MKLRVGVLAVQGAVSEHIDALRAAGAAKGIEVEAIPVRTPQDLASVHGLVLPGGESTTISRLLRSGHLQEPMVERARSGDLALFGTCAGLILLSSKAVHDVADRDIELLALLEAEVDRNAFGRQKDSFEAELEVKGVGTIPAVFIRAPVLTKTWDPTEVLAEGERGIVAVRKGLILGTAFHPELTGDTRMHELFLDLVAEAAAGPNATRQADPVPPAASPTVEGEADQETHGQSKSKPSKAHAIHPGRKNKPRRN